ncbi:efflux RND transporter periplasmic adaptor subunit [Patescibacteria group bacterium]|nr:efflux RND transporter periplasmic adaptor subunit [Patescibacteria group bacterium]MBU1472713.1 efflux RND transporter periplasmic adaptor subunit [Patescibacteria group bacterium]MBU2459980.1 efflux RND transporter periplasmic adaptor subunit [Patescibacteria group bacterium]MBU2544362.1 efflux RND transporter periplasmic adaptor subunit [Patescibacteria group bacterium]
MKRFIRKFWKYIVVFSVLALIGGIWWTRRAKQQTASAITTAHVKQETFIKTISSSGKTKADRSVSLKFQTSGKLTWVGIKEGDTVAPYQAIAALDSREVQKNLEKALRDYDKERNDFEETWRVDYNGKKPEQALTDTVKRILEKNQWNLERAVLDVELKRCQSNTRPRDSDRGYCDPPGYARGRGQHNARNSGV